MEKEKKSQLRSVIQPMSESEPKGKTLAPPPFQLKSGPATAPIQMAKKKRKVMDENDDVPKVKKQRNSYLSGQHGNKGSEQVRLKAKFGKKVDGKTHQSEHILGFQSLANVKGGRGSNDRLKNIENFAPAYQERYQDHRKNINTGNKTKQIDGSGFNATTFRSTQRQLIMDGDLSSAMQINQLSYAQQGGFQTDKNGPTIEERQSNSSFLNMTSNVRNVTYVDGDQDKTVSMSSNSVLEVLASRFVAKNSRYPNNYELWRLKMASERVNGFVNDESIFEPFDEKAEIERLNK